VNSRKPERIEGKLARGIYSGGGSRVLDVRRRDFIPSRRRGSSVAARSSTSHFKGFSEPKFGAIDRPVRATVAVVTCPAYFWSQVVPGK
jgi:hypothetical protein